MKKEILACKDIVINEKVYNRPTIEKMSKYFKKIKQNNY